MTVGEGILWSTIVIVLFASIVLLTKHKRWKTFCIVVASVVALGAAIAAGVYFYNEYEERPQVMSQLNGISLGMSEVEVTLSKGEPDYIEGVEPDSDGFNKVVRFGSLGDSSTFVILRGPKDSMAVDVICERGGYGRVLGFSAYSSETAILEKLGQPSNISVNENGTKKMISYPLWNAGFEIQRGSVVAVCVTSRSKLTYVIEYGESAEDEVIE